MKNVFISPAVYFELFPTKGKKVSLESIAQLKNDFLRSGSCRLLVTTAIAKQLMNSKELSSESLCVVVSKEMTSESEIKEFKDSRAVVCYLAKSLKDLPDQKRATLFDEIVLWIKKDAKGISDYSSLSKLKLLFDYDLCQDSVLKNLKMLPTGDYVSKYLELWPKVEMDLWYNPNEESLVRATSSDVDVSVIIPFQENWNELEVMLSNLLTSLQWQKNWEIVIVDDSWSDAIINEIQKSFPDLEERLTYVKLNRPRQRVRGDESFRAGVARNQAVKYARGKELVFVDSDILLGEKFWESLKEARSSHDGPLMPRRRQLTTESFLKKKSHHDFRIGEDTILSWGGHWESFYRNWQAEPHLWKWTSTYCLCVPKDIFVELGGFNRAFYCYGFEDTQLGYRLANSRRSLKIIEADVYHMPVSEGRSEFAGNQDEKKKILYKSFQVLLRTTLNPDLAALFQHVISKG